MSSVPSLRLRITQAFTDTDLRDVCLEHFPPVYDAFTVGMTKPQMIQILLDHCMRRGLGSVLLDALEQERPGLVGADREALLAQLDSARLDEAPSALPAAPLDQMPLPIPRQRSVAMLGVATMIMAGVLFLIWTRPWDGPTSTACPQSISFGQRVQCSIDKNNEIDIYTFTATKGDNIKIAMTPDSGTLEPNFELQQPNGTQVGGCTVGGAGRADGSCMAPSTGTYTLLVSDNLGNKTGT
jgi:hypothetical protein